MCYHEIQEKGAQNLKVLMYLNFMLGHFKVQATLRSFTYMSVCHKTSLTTSIFFELTLGHGNLVVSKVLCIRSMQPLKRNYILAARAVSNTFAIQKESTLQNF